MSDIVSIASPFLSAEIAPLGAELRTLRDRHGRDLLWDGDPAWWSGRAPILFPVVGAVAGGVIRVDDASYPMAKHGFARRRTWAVIERAEAAATFRLEDDAETRASYPFTFRLDVRFAIEGPRLAVVATLTNTGDGELPASFGYHPAFRWPLPDGGDKAAHRLTFAEEESAPIRRIDAAGLMRPDAEPSPVAGRVLAPDPAMFEDDALIFDRLASRALTYAGPTGPSIAVAFPDMPELGIWQKPRAPYLCIEPWAGFADPQGYAGPFRDKPGIVRLAPGSARDFTMRITVDDRALT